MHMHGCQRVMDLIPETSLQQRFSITPYALLRFRQQRKNLASIKAARSSVSAIVTEPIPISRLDTDVPEFSRSAPKDDAYTGCPAVRGGAKCSCPN